MSGEPDLLTDPKHKLPPAPEASDLPEAPNARELKAHVEVSFQATPAKFVFAEAGSCLARVQACREQSLQWTMRQILRSNAYRFLGVAGETSEWSCPVSS